jgi:hypothetical protein
VSAIEIYRQLSSGRVEVRALAIMSVVTMPPKRDVKHHPRIRWIVVLLVLVVAALFWVGASRFVSLPFLIAAWVLFLKYGRTTIRPSLIALTIWLPLTFSPVDILPMPKGGRPRLVPLVMGLPTRQTAERAQRGEVILGGCIVSGFEPKYYLVW